MLLPGTRVRLIPAAARHHGADPRTVWTVMDSRPASYRPDRILVLVEHRLRFEAVRAEHLLEVTSEPTKKTR